MSNDSKDELTLRIGEKLTAARIESGYTQSCAARAVGTSQSCISAVEHGKKQNVNIIIALIKLYGASYEDVFGLVKVREKNSALGCPDEGSELLRELIKDSGIKGLETQRVRTHFARLHIRILIPMLSYFGYYNTLFN